MPEPPHAGWKTGGGGRKGRLKNKWGKWLTAYNSGYQERIGLGGRESSAHIAQIHWYTLIDIQRLYPPFQSLSMSQLLYPQVTRPGGVSNPVTGSSIWNQPQAPSWYLRACIFAHCWKWQKKILSPRVWPLHGTADIADLTKEERRNKKSSERTIKE